ncbi:MAG: UDP-N-acetylmuramate dehydrogenase [Sphaerochaetaceae bacterium]
MSLTISNGEEKINKGHLILKNVPLSRYCTYGTGGSCDYFCQPKNLEEVQIALAWAKKNHQKVTILGCGSNVLISDAGVEGLVIITTLLTSYHVRGTLLCCEAGLAVDSAINLSIDNYLSGLEPLGGLPGSVGGAVYGSASANGLAIATLLEWVDYLDSQGNLNRYHINGGGFSYKVSPFTNTTNFIWEVTFRLKGTNNPSQKRREKEESRLKREEEGQYAYPSAGCIFKNPPQGPAGYFIEKAGFKGKRLEGARVSDKHANFIIKEDCHVTSQAIYELSSLVQTGVKEAFGITLEREIRLIGRW